MTIFSFRPTLRSDLIVHQNEKRNLGAGGGSVSAGGKGGSQAKENEEDERWEKEMKCAVALFRTDTYQYEEFLFTATDWGYYEYMINGGYTLVVKYLGY